MVSMDAHIVEAFFNRCLFECWKLCDNKMYRFVPWVSIAKGSGLGSPGAYLEPTGS